MNDQPDAAPEAEAPSAAARPRPAGENVATGDEVPTAEGGSKAFGTAGRPVAIGLGLVAVFAVGAAVFLGLRAGARETSLLQAQNRLDQVQAGVVVLQASLCEAKRENNRLAGLRSEAEAGTAEAKTDLVKAKTAEAETQTLLESSRANALRFQAQGEEAKVASIRHQGEAELARTQATVAKAQLAQATAALAEKDKQRTEAAAELEAWRVKLDRAEAELVTTRKSAVRK